MSTNDLPIPKIHIDSDEYEGTAPPKISAQQLKELSKLRPARFVAHISVEYALIAASIWISTTYWHPVFYWLVTLWIGSRMHALAILMHDVSHYRLFHNRKLNDVIGEVFLAWPITLTLYGYRRNHFAHHRFLNTDKDPDWVRKNKIPEYVLPKTRSQMVWIAIRYLSGTFALREIKVALVDAKLSVGLPGKLVFCRFVYYFTIVGTAIGFGYWRGLILYWLVPLLTSFLFLAYIRAVADHFGNFENGSHQSIYTQSRTTYFSFFEGFLLSPYNINYHIEHHFYPSVPFYNLKKLHEIVLHDPIYRQNAHITRGYLTGLYRECQELPQRSQPPCPRQGY